MSFKKRLEEFAADPDGLQKLVGITAGVTAVIVDILDVLAIRIFRGTTLLASLLDWYVLSVTAVGICGAISGFWKSPIARWMQVAMFFLAAVLNSLTSNTGGDVTGGIFLLFGLILLSEYRLGYWSIWIAGVVTFVIYPLALIVGYRNISHSYLVLALLTIVGVIGFIILYGGVLIRHELRHRLDRELLETRVKERTAELERAVAERSVMLQEIHHRVKNNLQIITSILRLEVDRQADATSRAAIEASIQRIFAMALVHETLYDTDQLESIDLVKYTGELLNLARDVSPIHFGLEAEGPIPVGLDFAVPFGILLNELVSNAEKHAFPQGAGGRVDIRIDSTEGILLAFADDGVGISEHIGIEGAKTLGLTLVKVLVQQLHGKIDLDRSAGTRWTIRFPKP